MKDGVNEFLLGCATFLLLLDFVERFECAFSPRNKLWWPADEQGCVLSISGKPGTTDHGGMKGLFGMGGNSEPKT